MKKYFWVISCSVLFCANCRKNSNSCDCPSNGNVCTDLPVVQSTYAQLNGPFFTYDTGYVSYPYFNPNDANQIIFYKPFTATGPELIKYNLSTRQQQVIFTQSIIGAPKWGKSGWILFSMGQTYKVKDNGDSLTQLTFSTGSDNYNPEWNYAGDKFITEHTGSNFDYIIYDSNGNFLASVPDLFSGVISWQNPNNLLLVNQVDNTLCVLNPVNDSLFIIPTTGINASTFNTGPVLWYPDGISILYGTSCGVYKMNYAGGSSNCIQSKCSNDEYLWSSVSAISQKIICEIDHWKSTNNGNNILITSKLVLMNFDGTGQQVIPVN